MDLYFKQGIKKDDWNGNRNMILKEIKIILSEKVAIEYKDLNRIVFEERKKEVDSSFHQTLLRSIERTRDLLRANPFYGNQISKKLIPKELIY